ncbi:MAG: hypothetical protein N3B18_11740 [Desulfobacterota bacterium]|nr:hypothetical protein [Thermodesulfobacteriota bacterium]
MKCLPPEIRRFVGPLMLFFITACAEDSQWSLKHRYENPYKKILLEKDRVSLHRIVIRSYHNALERNDVIGAAKINALFAGEACARSRRVLDFWMTEADAETHLFPTDLTTDKRIWTTRNAAADLFPFLVIAAHFLNETHLPSLYKALASEQALSGALARSVDLHKNAVYKEKTSSVIFGASEYCKDGLLPITERLGNNLFTARMVEIIDAIFERADFTTDYGLLPSTQAEVNGEMLQVLCRLYWMTGNEKYRTWARRIGDFYLLEAIPKNNFLPPYDVNPDIKASRKERCKLRDHGNEIIPGLAELYFLEAVTKGDRERFYYEPLKTMLDKLLAIGRNEHGMWYYALNVATEKPEKNRICDNWGYLYSAYETFALACEQAHPHDPAISHRYREAIRQTLANLKHYTSFDWGDLHQDGYADSIESALYMLNRFPSHAGFAWVDDEIQTLFAKQAPQGFVDATYLDGNYIRTLLLYAFLKTQGTYIKPWREDVLFGAHRDGEKLYLYLETALPWSGKLCFDVPRHREVFNLPVNYPRVNEWPEWFVVHEKKEYIITDLASRETKIVSGTQLREGIMVELKNAASVNLKIEPKEYLTTY